MRKTVLKLPWCVGLPRYFLIGSKADYKFEISIFAGYDAVSDEVWSEFSAAATATNEIETDRNAVNRGRESVPKPDPSTIPGISKLSDALQSFPSSSPYGTAKGLQRKKATTVKILINQSSLFLWIFFF
ncbi:MAG: hypothetical protein QM706_05775 [Nitrospira sp.]